MTGTVAYLDIADQSAWEIRSDDLTELQIVRVKWGAPVVLTFGSCDRGPGKSLTLIDDKSRIKSQRIL